MKLSLSAALLATTMLLPAAAFAQASAPARADAVDDTSEIVVTARKREESLQDVPIAITALGEKTLESARIESIADVAKLTPGLNFAPLFGKQNQLPIIRGVAQTLGQLNVGVFLDGVYLSGKAAVDLELNDLSRIEIIRGPQSALYGRNTFAGAINYVTKRPSATWTGRGEITGGEHGLFKAIGSVSGPLTETLRINAGGYYRRFNGFYTSAIDGGRVDFERGKGATGTLEWQPDPALIVTLRGTWSRDNDGQPPSNVIRNNAGLGVPAGAPATQTRNLLYRGELPSIATNGVLVSTGGINIQPGQGIFTVFRNFVGTSGVTAVSGTPAFPAITFFGDRGEAIRGSGTIQYEADDVRLTSITAYAYRSFDFTYDGDNTICDRTTPIAASAPGSLAFPNGGCPNFGFPFAVDAVGRNNYALSSSIGFSRDVSQELRAQSTGNGRFTWLMGLFYYQNTTDSIDRSIAPVLQATANTYLFPRTSVRTRSYSAFGSVGYDVTDALHLTAELRYEYEQQRLFIGITNPAGGGTSAATATLVSPNVSNAFDLGQDFRFATPRFIIDYKLSPDALLYASYARGAKTGGFNTGTNVFADQRSFRPEFANNYEFGVKASTSDKRLRANAAFYLIDWKNQQVVDQNPVTAGGSSTNRSYTANTATSRIYGVELDAAWSPITWFTLNGAYTYTHARYRSFTDVTLNGTAVPLVGGTLSLAGLPNISFVGNRLPYVPDHKFSVSPVVTLPFSEDGTIEARADLQYQSTTVLRADNFAFFPSRTNLDLRLTARYKNISLQLFANNVTDNARPVAGVRFFDSTNFSASSPYITGVPRRQLGAAIGYKF